MPDPYLACPHAEYRACMMIWCKKANDYCGHAYFMRCKGWWALTPRWPACPLLSSGSPSGGAGA